MIIPDGRAQSFPILLSVSVEGMQTDILDPRQFCNLRLLALDLGTVEGLDPTRSRSWPSGRTGSLTFELHINHCQ